MDFRTSLTATFSAALKEWAYMKQKLALAVLAVVSIATTYGGAMTLKSETKFNVCHNEGKGKGHVIVVAESALKAHFAHGDSGAAGWQKAGEPCQLPGLK